jgi:hypothetical protein
VKLLLDEMHDPGIARALRERGHDVISAAEDVALSGLPDRDLLGLATLDGRAVVTENIKDFAPLHAWLIERNEPHAGLVFTHPRRFPRAEAGTTRQLIAALDQLLSHPPSPLEEAPAWVWWLERPEGA